MASKITPWQEHHGLTICPATAIDPEIPAAAWRRRDLHAHGPAEKTFLIIESRAQSLRALCQKRLETAQLPPLAELTVAFKAEVVPDPTLSRLDAECRRQITLASTLRRALRPALRSVCSRFSPAAAAAGRPDPSAQRLAAIKVPARLRPLRVNPA